MVCIIAEKQKKIDSWLPVCVTTSKQCPQFLGIGGWGGGGWGLAVSVDMVNMGYFRMTLMGASDC